MRRLFLGIILTIAALCPVPTRAQEKSVNPGINKNYEHPDAEDWAKKFETESREIYHNRAEIVAACKIKPGMAVADVGAGTGLFTRLFAKEVTDTGKIYAVDIADSFLKHIDKSAADAGMKNITTVLCTEDNAKLPENSADLVFICDTYHHFEFPQKTLASIHKAIKPGGRLVLIDFVRIEGVTQEWILKHVRASQEVFTKEITDAGFKQVEQVNLLKENYMLIFQKVDAPKPAEK